LHSLKVSHYSFLSTDPYISKKHSAIVKFSSSLISRVVFTLQALCPYLFSPFQSLPFSLPYLHVRVLDHPPGSHRCAVLLVHGNVRDLPFPKIVALSMFILFSFSFPIKEICFSYVKIRINTMLCLKRWGNVEPQKINISKL
jgi:hypothetical protein